MDQAIEQISAEVPDWSRERPRRFWDPGRKLLLTVRRYQVWQARGGVVGALCCKLIAARHRFWSVVTGAEIPLTCQIGGGLLVPHPNGIVIHPDARIGVNAVVAAKSLDGLVNWRFLRGFPERPLVENTKNTRKWRAAV